MLSSCWCTLRSGFVSTLSTPGKCRLNWSNLLSLGTKIMAFNWIWLCPCREQVEEEFQLLGELLKFFDQRKEALPYFLRQDLPLNLVLTVSARLTGHWAPEICLSPHPQIWVDSVVYDFYVRNGNLTHVLCLCSKHFIYWTISIVFPQIFVPEV